MSSTLFTLCSSVGGIPSKEGAWSVVCGQSAVVLTRKVIVVGTETSQLSGGFGIVLRRWLVWAAEDVARDLHVVLGHG
jgi:hypothetical protein